ncbi:MAG: hypothetical protein L0H78_06400 [Humibacillus sp.]|nr:hypothetical protein [Humibacillus sp.]
MAGIVGTACSCPRINIWVPIFLGLITAVVGRAVLSTSRLRRDLDAHPDTVDPLTPLTVRLHRVTS